MVGRGKFTCFKYLIVNVLRSFFMAFRFDEFYEIPFS